MDFTLLISLLLATLVVKARGRRQGQRGNLKTALRSMSNVPTSLLEEHADASRAMQSAEEPSDDTGVANYNVKTKMCYTGNYEMCWKNSYTRGAGYIANKCREDGTEERIGSLL